MNIHELIEKLNSAAPGSFHILDAAKSRRMNAKTMYIPSPTDVAKAILAIPEGHTKDISELREELAIQANADIACPGATNKYWKWLAIASEHVAPNNSFQSIPWWRILKGGKASRHMPGGVDEHLIRLKAEGVALRFPNRSPC